MNRIESFKIDHTKLLPGIYVSLVQHFGEQTVTTFDIRLCRPIFDPVMSTGIMHTIEHIAATYLRNLADVSKEIIYFGPMGCRTGFYLVMNGELSSVSVWDLLKQTFAFIAGFEGDIPGATPVECGNYSDMDLDGAKKISAEFLKNVLENPSQENMNYPK